MRISLNKIKSYLPKIEISDAELVKLIGSRLVEVEEVIDLKPKYNGIYIVKVLSAELIPDTHLHLCQIDAGKDKPVQVVCGAPNAHAGMLAAWITPGSIVPATYDNENFRLSVRKLRGYDSNGMLAAEDELDLGEDHDGIIEIDPKTPHPTENRSVRPGDNFAEVFSLNDLILDVENKSLTHRPDCFGLIGFAREVAGILGVKFTNPAFYDSSLKTTGEPEVEIADPALCPRYSCAVFDLPDNTKSKYFTPDMAFLAKSGMRSIDPMVDLTNIIMLETGQPLHAFDYDKFISVGGSKSARIIVRAASEGEEIQLLNGKTIKCSPDDILITSNGTPVALAGAMGGKNTEIDPSTKRVILESATFSLYNLRKTQMAHGIFSEAITRFTKGQPAAMTMPILAETLSRLNIAPLAVSDAKPCLDGSQKIKLNLGQINGLLGQNYSKTQIVNTLENVGFAVKALESTPDAISEKTAESTDSSLKASKNASKTVFTVTAPVWRTDIHVPEDVIEEIGRLNGYDNIPLSLPERPFAPAMLDRLTEVKREIRNIAADNLCLHEVLTYSFISRDLLEKVGQNPDDSYEIVNSISPELQCFRQQIVPSLLDKIRENIKAGHRDFGLFEQNQVISKQFGFSEENIPVIKTNLGIVQLGDFYQIKAIALALWQEMGLELEYRELQVEDYPYLEPVQSAEIVLEDQVIGAFGNIKQSVLNKFKLDQPVAALELNLDAVQNLPRQLKGDLKISKFPAVERDLTLKVAADAPFGRIRNVIESVLDQTDLYYTVIPVSIYQVQPETKNLSFHLRFAHPDHTLKAEEIKQIMDNIAVTMSEVGATII